MRFLKAKRIFARVSRFGFTLMEVNLAIFIMATGLLAMVAVYPLAYRESQQSKDDVRAAAAADCILNTLTGALSSRNIEWKDWVDGISSAVSATRSDQDGGGWLDYYDPRPNAPRTSLQTIKTKGQGVFNSLAGIYTKSQGTRGSLNFSTLKIPSELACAIVAQWGQMPVWNGETMQMLPDHSRVAISVRVTRRVGDLLGQPIFYTEIHFQGDQHDLVE